MTDFDQELTARRAVVAQANTTTITSCPRCGQHYHGATMCPDFDEPGQLTEAERAALAERLGNLSQAVDEARGPHDDQVIVPAPKSDEPPPSGWRDKPGML